MFVYGPDERPDLDPEAVKKADRLGLHPVQVICFEPGNQADEELDEPPPCVSFYMFVNFLPRLGDTLWLEDGKRCQVKEVIHKLVTVDGMVFVQNVVGAQMIQNENDD